MLESWLAGVLDFNGTLGIRLGSRQMQPYIAVYSKNKEYLEQLRDLWPDFSVPVFVSRNLYMSQIVSISGTLKMLEEVFPYLYRLSDVAETIVKFCKSRLDHPNEKYSIYELQLAQEVIEKTSRPGNLTRRLEVLDKWV